MVHAIPEVAQARKMSLSRYANMFTLRTSRNIRICMGINGRALNRKKNELSLNETNLLRLSS